MECNNYQEKGLTTELILEGENDLIELRGKSFKNVICNYTAKLFIFSGRISDDTPETKMLAEWAKVSNESKEHLRNMTMRVVRGDHVVRELELNNVYIISYDEDYGSNTYSIVVSQHNKITNSDYMLVPLSTDYGRAYALVQPRDDKTSKMLKFLKKNENDIVLGLNSAGSLAVMSAGKEGIKALAKFGIKQEAGFLMRFNLYYLATHGTNLIISTASDLYFKVTGYEEGVGKVNPLRDIYEETGCAVAKAWSFVSNTEYDEEKARNIGNKAFYDVDLVGAIGGLATTTKSVFTGGRKAYKIKMATKAGYAVRQYKASYIILSGGALVRDINPLYSDGKEILRSGQ